MKMLGEVPRGQEKKCTFCSAEAYGLLRNSISEIKATSLSDPIIKPRDAVQIFNMLSHEISMTKYDGGKDPQDIVLDKLPSTNEDQLLHHWTFIQEALRHFWSSYLITSSYLHAKVDRLKDAMAQIYPQLEEIKKAVPSDDGQLVSVLVRQMLQALDAAFQHYDAALRKWSQRTVRNQKGTHNTIYRMKRVSPLSSNGFSLDGTA